MIEVMTPTATTKKPANGKVIALDIGGKCYRLRRYDHLNLVVEGQTDPDKAPLHLIDKPAAPRWKPIAYLGNSQRALVRELSELVIEGHTPIADAQLIDQIEALRRDFVEGVKRIEAALQAGASL